MTLRVRLTLTFLALALTPVLAAVVVLSSVLPQRAVDAAVGHALVTRAAAESMLPQLCAQAAAASVQLAQGAAHPQAAVQAAVDGGASGAVLLTAHGRVAGGPLGPAAGSPALRTGADCRTAAFGTPPAGVDTPAVAVTTLRDARGRVTGRAVAAYAVSSARLAALPRAAGVVLVAVHGDGSVAATSGPTTSGPATRGPAVRAAEVARAAADRPAPPGVLVRRGHRELVGVAVSGGGALIVAADIRPTVTAQLALVVGSLAVLGLAAWLAALLARVLVRPLGELADAAARVATGDLTAAAPVRSRDEVGALATAFNAMTGELRSYVGELQRSRDELRANVARLGATLSGTHDLDRILSVVVDTAVASVRGEAGAVLLTSGDRGHLSLTASRGLSGRLADTGAMHPRLPTADGLLGTVVHSAEPAWGGTAVTAAAAPPGVQHVALGAAEPAGRQVLAVPLLSDGAVTGVLAVYDRAGDEAFSSDDVATLRSFAGQASVAIDNVLLHQEAQRLSITDGLTGLWNYRYLAMAVDREVERATRFGRPLAALMLDLDRFKGINDVHGHQRGDAVLVELAARVRRCIREVDVFARYGGEEFVLLLPETEQTGAEQLADRIVAAVGAEPFRGVDGEAPLHVTASAGVALWPAHGPDGASLLRAADGALYAAKAAGRNCWRTAATEGGPAPDPSRERGRDARRD